MRVRWNELINLALDHGRSREEIATTIRELVAEGLISDEEAEARIEQVDRQIAERQARAH